MASLLLAEDSDLVRFALAAFLRSAGHSVTEAADGEKASRALAEAAFEVLITDVFMPERDGVELIKQVRRDYPTIKILALSGGGARQAPHYALRLATAMGAHAAMQKPVDNQALAQQIAAMTADLQGHDGGLREQRLPS